MIYQSEITNIKAILNALRARVNSVTTAGGALRITQDTLAGGIWEHDHSDVASGGIPEFVESIPSDWLGNTDPGNLWQAINQLASRIKVLEQLVVGIAPVSYPADTMLFNGME